jgi:hypothetical protein
VAGTTAVLARLVGVSWGVRSESGWNTFTSLLLEVLGGVQAGLSLNSLASLSVKSLAFNLASSVSNSTTSRVAAGERTDCS